ncbi:MAG: rpsA [Acidobacteria bacterium]|nr:rpsA [Acidobacteriota bacterium]
MSETGIPPVIAEPSAAEAEGAVEATAPDVAPAAAAPLPEAPGAEPQVAGAPLPEAPAETETAEASAPATAEDAAPETAEASAPESEAFATGESAPAAGSAAAEGKPGAAAKAKKGAKRRTHRPGARAEEFVAPTPEDLAGIPSDAIRQAVELGHPVEGKIIGWNQGGFHAVVDGITSFCPRSSMELGPPHEPGHYLDQTYVFRVLRVEEKGHRLILSRTAMLREERRRQAEEMRAQLEVGAIVEGRVVALADFGAFVDIGGIEGLVHVSEIRHGRVAHAHEALHVGQHVQAKVIKLGKGSERVSLSIKALEPDPWQGSSQSWAAGGRFSGKVLRRTEFGWFVELAPGVEGLLHPSQLKHGMKPEDEALQPGATIEGWIRELDPIRRRVSLSLRETATGNPWEGVESKYSEGTRVTGTVEKIAPFGAFIVLEPGLTGLLPTSEMGLPRGASIGKAYQIGKQVTLQVAQVDSRRKRISLTLEGKTLEGSRSDYQNYLKKSRRADGMGALAAAFERIKDGPG